VKRKTRKVTRSLPVEAEPLETKPAAAYQRYTKASQDELVADLARGIKDLPVWKDYVRRFGLKAARNILRRGLVLNEITDGNSEN